MKIIKLNKNTTYNHYNLIVDEIPELTYVEYKGDFIGSATNGIDIIFSNYLKRQSFGNAFGGREISLNMKDGTQKTIKDYWFDAGYCSSHGEFIQIGIATLKDLQNCYVYYSRYIKKNFFEKMLDEYFKYDRLYTYQELEKMCKLHYRWYDVVIGGVKYPLMVNKVGDFVYRETKEPVYVRNNYYKLIGEKWFNLCLFKYEFNNGDKLVKIEKDMLSVLMESLPYTKKEIIENCKLKEYVK